MHAETFLSELLPLASGPSGIQKLRELVLLLAMRGKLVSQNASEGHAEAILAKIESDADSAIKKRIAKYKSLDPLYQTPNNWTWTTIGAMSRDWGQKVPNRPFQYIDVGGIDNLKGQISHELELVQPDDAPSRARKLIARGTVIYSTVRPYLKNIAIVDREFPFEAIASTAFAIVHPLGDIVPEYVFYYLRSPDFVAYVEGQMMGVAYPAINDSKFFAAPIPLPPVAEQKRIVTKVDKLMALCDELEALQAKDTELKRASAASVLYHLTKAATQEEATCRWSLLASRFGELFDDLETIKALRNHILDLAATGKLIEYGSVDDVQDLISEIERERNAKNRSKKKESTEHYQVDLNILPKHWAVLPLSSLVWDSNYGTSNKCDASGNGQPVLRIPNISNGTVRLDDLKRAIDLMELAEDEEVKPGDLLIVRTNGSQSLIGRGAVVSSEFDKPTYFASYLIRFRLCQPERLSRWISTIWHSPFIRSHALRESATTAGQYNLSQSKLARFPIPLPPETEMAKIVAKVDELMVLCDRLEEQVREGERLNGELMASLAHAMTKTAPDGGVWAEPVSASEDASAVTAPRLANENAPETPNTKSPSTSFIPETKTRSTPDLTRSVDTKFQEAVLVASIVQTFFQVGGEPIGNFRLQKAVYFARRVMGEHVSEMAYLRKAAGPYNPSMKYSGGIAIAKQKNWLHEARGRYGFGHVPGANIADAGEWIATYRYDSPSRWVTEHFRYKKNEEWETLATVDYVIEHLQTLGIEPDPAQILQYIASDVEWHPKIEKLRLTEMSVATAKLEVQTLFSTERGDQ